MSVPSPSTLYNKTIPTAPTIANSPGTTNPSAPLPVLLAVAALPVPEAALPDSALSAVPLALALPVVFASLFPLAVLLADADAPVFEEEDADEVIAMITCQ